MYTYAQYCILMTKGTWVHDALHCEAMEKNHVYSTEDIGSAQQMLLKCLFAYQNSWILTILLGNYLS